MCLTLEQICYMLYIKDEINKNQLEVKMGVAKIEFKLGCISFSGEGEDTWLEKQLDKIMEKAPHLIKIVPPSMIDNDNGVTKPGNEVTQDNEITSISLANFLISKNATKNQTQKFLVTSVWLQAKGQSRISTSDVTKALKDSSQSRIGNPSECLKKNIAKGFIEKDGDQFYVTPEGKSSIK